MKHIKHINLSEDANVFSDPFYANDVFKVRYRSINDLSNKKGSDLPAQPTNDLLDGYQNGDVVVGKGIKDDEEHTGIIVSIKRDSEGENVEIRIEEDGKVLSLYPSSIKFAEDGDKGNQQINRSGEYDTKGNTDHTFLSFNTFAPYVYEASSRLKNLKTINDF